MKEWRKCFNKTFFLLLTKSEICLKNPTVAEITDLRTMLGLRQLPTLPNG